MINKTLAGMITIGFMAAVRPDPEPSRWGIALVSVLMYEGIRISLDYIQKVNARNRRKQQKAMNDKWLRYDGKRWADEWIRWPIKEVS